tara:strand:- start:55786 stop:57390 length:1605 start_codon:yes stop_codon:yes gene_type:complete
MRPPKTKTRDEFHVHYTDSNDVSSVEIKHAPLVQFLRDYVDDIEGIYENTPNIGIARLLGELGSLRQAINKTKSKVADSLLNFLEDYHSVVQREAINMIAQGKISYRYLRMLFSDGKEIALHGPAPQGGVVKNTHYRESFFGNYFQINFEIVGSSGQGFTAINEDTVISEFKGVKNIAELSVQPVSADMKAKLTERGQVYRDIALGNHYRQYQGFMEVYTWMGWRTLRCSGRIMVDIASYFQFKNQRGPSDLSAAVVLNDESLWMASAYISGFSLNQKQWGRFEVSAISKIDFQKRAFDQLVLDSAKKNLVQALVSDNNSGFSDIISGKGGGCIFLLHGEPGVGKTLTAEAVSELLERPLYMVSVGELGVNSSELEKNLRQILDVAQVWNAVILIDEADIFLEKRTPGDVVRNSLVSVFLKLLEYHQGVLFLTTNRVADFDPAFHSRISIAMHYGRLDQEARLKIWNNLLDAAGITGINAHDLSVYALNGRQIKNTIRLAQGVARQEKLAVTHSHFMTCIGLGQQFDEQRREHQ